MDEQEHPADATPDVDYAEITRNLNSGKLPDYELPRVSTDHKGLRVIEVEEPDELKHMKDYSGLYKQLRSITKQYGLKDGDKVIMHDKQGHQFGYSKDSRHDDPEFGYFFPPKGLMM